VGEASPDNWYSLPSHPRAAYLRGDDLDARAERDAPGHGHERARLAAAAARARGRQAALGASRYHPLARAGPGPAHRWTGGPVMRLSTNDVASRAR